MSNTHRIKGIHSCIDQIWVLVTELKANKETRGSRHGCSDDTVLITKADFGEQNCGDVNV